jgi:hypothetical protein
MDDSKLAGFLPEHLALNPHQPLMDKRCRGGKFFDPLRKLKKGEYRVTTIFSPDQRYVFSDTSFPWCTTGRVDVGGGWGQWRVNGSFPSAVRVPHDDLESWQYREPGHVHAVVLRWATPLYEFRNHSLVLLSESCRPNLSGSQIEQDYVVLVLSNRLGDICGWMDIRGYSDSWNGLTGWSQIGWIAPDVSKWDFNRQHGGKRPD